MARAYRTNDVEDVDDVSVAAEAGEEAVSSSEAAEMAASREDAPEARSVTSRSRIRDQLCSDSEAFLARGGAIDRVDPHVMADPPRRPTSEYGSRPI